MEDIKIKSTSKDTMAVSHIVLRENSTTRLVFYPTWVDRSEHPLRGGFRFQRKSPKNTWEDIDHKPLSSLKKDEGYELNLEGVEVDKLLSQLDGIRKLLGSYGHQYGTHTFVVSQENVRGVFLQIGDNENRDWIIAELKRLEKGNFENLGAAVARARLEGVIEEFEKNMSNSDEDFWRKFFERNPWVLQQVFAYPVIYVNGETFLGGKDSKGRQGSGGTATDFLFMHGSNGSYGVVEIKTPKTLLVGSLYRGKSQEGKNNEVHQMHGDLTGGVVQMENQIHVANEYFESQLGKDFQEKGLGRLNPCGVLVAGTYTTLNDSQKRSFDLFRKSMGKNQIHTFDEVLAKLKLLKTVYGG